MPDLGWTEAQWEKVNSAVTEAFGKASVASAFLPCYGPLAGSVETVRDEQISFDFNERGQVKVSDDGTLKLCNLTVKVELSSEQVADESLSSALLAFRRAANILAQVEDEIVFNGFARDTDDENQARSRRLRAARKTFSPKRTQAIVVSRLDSIKGLSSLKPTSVRVPNDTPGGEPIVTRVVEAIAALESDSHPGPFACVLGKDLFVEAHRPTVSMVLPADRITPLLNGPLLRSGEMEADRGIVVSLGSGAVDIVVATPPRAQFLQLTEEAKCLFRVYERFVLRLKDPATPAVRDFQIVS